jgi:hypothetical protein
MGERGGRAKSYDSEKAWSSRNHSILSEHASSTVLMYVHVTTAGGVKSRAHIQMFQMAIYKLFE